MMVVFGCYCFSFLFRLSMSVLYFFVWQCVPSLVICP